MQESINPIGLVVTIASLSVLPLVAVTATSFLKISAVLLILRNAIGVQQVPSNMVLYGISMVMSLLIMGPVLTDAGQRFAPEGKMPVTGVEVLTSINDAVPPFKQFMMNNVNPDYLEKFYSTAQQFQKKYDAAPVSKSDLFVVMPAFVASELAEAFRIGLYLYLPFVIIDLAVSSALMALGMMMVSPVTAFPPVLGLHANCVPSSDLTHGATMSMCVIPRSHPRHSPHFSLRAGMPQLMYFATAQSCACCICGLPTNRGPMPSINSCPSFFKCELSVASLIMRLTMSASFCCAKPTVLSNSNAINNRIMLIQLKFSNE